MYQQPLCIRTRKKVLQLITATDKWDEQSRCNPVWEPHDSSCSIYRKRLPEKATADNLYGPKQVWKPNGGHVPLFNKWYRQMLGADNREKPSS